MFVCGGAAVYACGVREAFFGREMLKERFACRDQQGRLGDGVPPPHTLTQVDSPASPPATKTEDDLIEAPSAASQVRPKDVIRVYTFVCCRGRWAPSVLAQSSLVCRNVLRHPSCASRPPSHRNPRKRNAASCCLVAERTERHKSHCGPHCTVPHHT